SRRAISAATAGASCWFRSARLTAPTSSPEAGSRGSAVRRIRSGRWRRASSLRTENFRGSGTGSYEPTTRNRAARAPPASAASVTTSPTRTPASCISCRDRSTVGRSGGGGAALRLASALGGGPAGAAPAHRQRIDSAAKAAARDPDLKTSGADQALDHVGRECLLEQP